VPCSKNDVFSDKQISLLEKRCLMKFLQMCMQMVNEEDSAEVKRVKGQFATPFATFLKKEKLSKSLQEFVLYAIADAEQDQALSPMNTEDGMNSVVRYLRSVGRFGATAFLAINYGIGELPQGFCRLCAVHGGVYVLNREVKEINADPDTGRFTSLVCGAGQTLTSRTLVCAPEYMTSFQDEAQKRRISRCVCITNKPLFDEQCHHALLTVPPGAHRHPIQVIQFGSSTSACPDGQFVITFFTEAVEASPELDLDATVKQLLLTGDAPAENEDKPCVLWGVFYHQLVPAFVADSVPGGVHMCPSTRPSPYNGEASCEAAKHIFHSICPDEEFLPKKEDSDEEEGVDDYGLEGECQDGIPS